MRSQIKSTLFSAIIILMAGIHCSMSQSIQLLPPTNLTVDTFLSIVTWYKPVDTINIKVPELLGYRIKLDGTVIVFNTPDTVSTLPYICYGQWYTVEVAAEYSIGFSEYIGNTFLSGYLMPPFNLEGVPFDNSVYLTWNPPVCSTFTAPPVPSYKISFYNTDHSMLPAPKPILPAMIECKHINNQRNINRDAGPIGWMNDLTHDEWKTLDITTYSQNTIGPAGFMCLAGDFPREYEDRIYASNYNSGETLIEIDIETGTYSNIASMPNPLSSTGGVWAGFACDKSNGIMYAMCTDMDESMLCTINTGTGEVTQIGSQSTAPGIIEIAFNAITETMFGWCIVHDACYIIDISTGEVIQLGPLGYNANYAQGGSWNPWDKNVYLTAYDDDEGSQLRILDQATGATVLLTSLDAEMDILGFPGSVGNWNPYPIGLTAYRIYRDADSIGQVDHPTYEYYDFDLWPGIYEYTLTAIYDLAFYGYSGYGESQQIGPVTIIGPYWWYLPFFEGWEYGCFEANNWKHEDCKNWIIDTIDGNPAPCAVFHWDSTLSDYSCKIISYAMDGHEILDGEIYLDFNIKLDDNNGGGTESLSVYLSNHEDSTFQVYEYINTGSFGWMHQSFKISEFAKGEFFSVVFEATGENSSNILNWFVDNIYVYRVCQPPAELFANYYGSHNLLTWEKPDGEADNRSLLGYNIFRNFNESDWEMINDEMVADTFYKDDGIDTAGYYCYFVTSVYDQCESDSSINACVNIISSLPDFDLPGIVIFPNPASDYLHIEYPIIINTCHIFNEMGKLVYSKHKNQTKTMTADISTFNNGLYFLMVETATGQSCRSFIVSR